jgi:hypothetical protein
LKKLNARAVEGEDIEGRRACDLLSTAVTRAERLLALIEMKKA